ncbi:replication initiation factor domain-containing protein [Terasakiella pusilla]|uniref:replication initiation factor domain-containing protein n=1 Tax=Terasakiella pusilla TaxID=64973 RepID=UPI003AA89C2E
MSKISTGSAVESIKTLREMQKRAAASIPPSSNTGGKDDQLAVKHRAKVVEAAPKPFNGQAAIVDTLTFTIPLSMYLCTSRNDSESDVAVCPEVLRSALGFDLFDQLDLELTRPVGRGRNFYRDHMLIRYAGAQHEDCFDSIVGFVAYGGNRDTVCIHLSGKACEHISVLAARYETIECSGWYHIRQFIAGEAGQISRIDLAYDDLDGKQGGVDAAVDWYCDGHFTAGGRRPSCSMAGDWLFSKSRTFYVGKRDNGKLIRVYEKGHQQGCDTSPWVRYEAEIHRTRYKTIPLDAIIDPTSYLAGSAPCLAFVLDVPPICIRNVVKKKAKIGLDHLKHWASVSYGRLLHVMKALGATPDEILAALSVVGVPSRLDVPPAETVELRPHHPLGVVLHA